MDLLRLPRANILAYTMPGFATGAQSKRQAWALMQALEVSSRELDIRPAATQMLKDMGHPFGQGEPVYDITFENVQAGLRTDYLFRLANHHGGLVIGTGDLSELALGWCTYGVGDQMAYYNVNSGVPKTLIQHLIRWVISSGQFSDDVSQTLRAIIAAEISPELVPVDEGQKPQSTEAAIGPYALQDLNLFYTLRFGFRPSKIAFLAMHAWKENSPGRLAGGFAGRAAIPLRIGRYPEMVGSLSAAVFCFQSVQTFRNAERPEGLSRWFVVTEGRLAGAVRRQCFGMAGRP